MNRRISGVIGGVAVAALSFTVLPAATAAPSTDTAPDRAVSKPDRLDDRPDPLHVKRRELTERAVDQVVSGQAKLRTRGGGQAIKLGRGQWVEYDTEQTAQLFSILVEFGDETDPRFPDAPAGPQHNQIPEPTGSDNSTYWKPDFSRQHFLDMFFNGMPDQRGESFRDLYDEMSSGRFDLEGDVTDWVQVPNNEASYGQTESNTDMSRFIEDSANAWVEQQRAAGKSDAEIVDYLEQFDVWDRYDHDSDGVFDEADGYIDHFQAIHAGEGEEAGAPEWAIWSHRWAARPNDPVGPEGAKQGGVEIGDTGLWIRDYTTEPENGGLGVFAHEFAHDLGLPDYYDTAGGENSTAFWTLMSSGSWLSHGDGAIGTTPNHMGAHEKLFLGWLDYETVAPGARKKVVLGPSHHATKKPQAVIVNLPPGKEFVEVGEPFDGKYLYSGTGDDRTSTVTSPAFTVPAGAALTAKVNYAIEADWDYAYAEISTDGGATFTPLATNRSTDTNENGQNDGHGITGTTEGAWVDLTADLTAYAGQSAQVRFRHVNDAAAHEIGLLVDDIAVGDALREDVEDDAAGWAKDGFSVIDGTGYEQDYERYYIAENRAYRGYDSTLRTGPYNFGWANTAPNKVEHFPYQDGLLITYVNGLYGDNNVSEHPGYGEALPVDAHPKALRWSDGTVARNRIQAFDATFGAQPTNLLRLHRETEEGMTRLISPWRRGVRVFDDTDPMAYYDESNPMGSVIVAGTGTQIKVLGSNPFTGQMKVGVN